MKLSAIKPVTVTLFRELWITTILLLGVSMVVFLILYAAPGDPFSVLLAGQSQDDATREEIRQAIGMSGSWYGQYIEWLKNMLHGDFGSSIRTGQPVLDDLIVTGLNTLYLTVGAIVLTLIIALPIATYSATQGVTPVSWFLTMIAYIVSALPVFWLGYIVIYLITEYFGIFPLAVGNNNTGNIKLLQFILPILVLGFGSGIISEVIRMLRDEISRVLDDEYIRTAKAKGASIWRHAFKEAYLLPVTEIVANKVPFLLGGAIIVEQVFNRPGMGRLAWQAAQDRDFPVILGIAITSAILVRIAGLTQKVIYVAVNPRASHE